MISPASFKNFVLAGLSAAARRHAVLLPQVASGEDSLLKVRTAYRVDSRIKMDLEEEMTGLLSVEALRYAGHFPREVIWQMRGIQYPGRCTLALDLDTGSLLLGDRELGQLPAPFSGRRLAWRLELVRADGTRATRTTGHYRSVSGRAVDEGYYYGDDYVDYEVQSAGEHSIVTDLMERFGGKGPVLEIGCATGGLLDRLLERQVEAYGLDLSEWAIGKVHERCGPGRGWVCNVELEDLPESLVERGPFKTLVLWAVYEHFLNPVQVLEKLSRHAAPGALLLINTTNCDSLSPWVFGRDWEGYFDWTHLGVDKVSVNTLRNDLTSLGWRIEMLETHDFWHNGVDPDHACLRETFVNDARFRQLLATRDLGDLLVCVATRR